MDSGFLELMPHTISVEHYTGVDAWGNSTYSAAESVRCRIDSDRTESGVAEGGDGRLTVLPHRVLTLYTAVPATAYDLRDRITLPDDDIVRIAGMEVFHDETTTPHHWVLELATMPEV